MTIPKHCSRCGAAFGCGRDAAGCWCTTLPQLPRAALTAGADCLCPDCLRAAVAAAGRADGDPPDTADPH